MAFNGTIVATSTVFGTATLSGSETTMLLDMSHIPSVDRYICRRQAGLGYINNFNVYNSVITTVHSKELIITLQTG